MRITAVNVYDADYGKNRPRKWNPILVQVRTDENLTGVGEVGLAFGSGSKAAAHLIVEFAREYLLNQDPFRIEAIWDTLLNRTFWGQGGGPIFYGAMSAIDEALWDLKGKALGVPVYELLGGKVFDRLRLYANGWYQSGLVTPEEYADGALRVVADGYTALKLNPFLISAEGLFEHPRRHLDKSLLHLGVDRVRAIRDAIGPHVDILIELHGDLRVVEAIQVGNALEDLHPFFLEEPVDPLNVECMKKVSDRVDIPIAGGERLYSRYQFRPFVEQQALDIIQPDIGLAGGLTEVRKIASYAETYQIHVQPHLFGGPVAAAAAIQFDACTTSFLIQEWCPYDTTGQADMVNNDMQAHVKDGYLEVPDEPGLGVVLDEGYMKRFQCFTVS